MSVLKRVTLGFVMISLLMLGLARAETVDVTDPMKMLQSIANNMISELKKNRDTLKTNPRRVYSIANRLVVPYADIEEMSARVLSPEVWAKMSVAQQKQFDAEFTTLLVRTYASALAAYKDQAITFFPVRGGIAGKNMLEVNSEINSEGNVIRVTYRLLRKGTAWKLYDMSVEGVSLLESFRAQFSDLLKQGDVAALLKKMSNHNQ